MFAVHGQPLFVERINRDENAAAAQVVTPRSVTLFVIHRFLFMFTNQNSCRESTTGDLLHYCCGSFPER